MSNVIKFEKPKTITRVMPVIVTREEARMIMGYQNGETDLLSRSLAPRPNIKIVK